MRLALYDAIESGARRQLHQRVVDAIDGGGDLHEDDKLALAHHLSQTGGTAQRRRGLQLALDSARSATAKGEHEAAQERLELAHRLVDADADDGTVAEILLGLGLAKARRGARERRASSCSAHWR